MQTANLHDELRPKCLEDVSGNERTIKDLGAALSKAASGKAPFPSTLLLHGPRGCGKTTLAFLVARYLNCETGDACGECPSCKAMDDVKNHPDVMFVDIGSKGKVEDVRNLLQHVNRSPRYNKNVIVLDEVHALGSQAAATALLATLESPPPNTVFALCTTNPEKLLGTIVSRSIQYKLTTLTESEIVLGLARAAREMKLLPKSKEGKSLARACFKKMAEASGGHMRDALSIFQRYVPNLDSADDWDVEDVDACLESMENISTTIDVLIAILKMDLPDVIAALRSVKEVRALMHSLRWLLFYVIGDAAKANKFQTADLKAFLAEKQKQKVKYNLPLLIKLQAVLVETEQAMNAGVHESIALETKICELMVNEYERE